jgi:hypothetical protein
VPDAKEILQKDEFGNYVFDIFNQKPLPLSSYNPALTNALRTLLISAHGKEQSNSPFFRLTSNFPKKDKKDFTLGQIAIAMGKDTNKIHNVIISACESGNCAKKQAFGLFPNATNVVHSQGGPGSLTSAREMGRSFGSGEGQTNPNYALASTVKKLVRGRPQLYGGTGLQMGYETKPFYSTNVYGR